MARLALLALWLCCAPAPAASQDPAIPADLTRISDGRLVIYAGESNLGLARNLLADAVSRDSFPGLPRPVIRATILIAANESQFREWIGPGIPEWGIAVAFPEQHRIVMQGRDAGADAGDPRVTLRHELAHLALHERMGAAAPHWFDEGYASYAAGEWGRDEILASSFVLAIRGTPRFAGLDSLISAGSARASQGYALAHRAVADMAALGNERGLALLFQHWPGSRNLDEALRRAYGVTLDGFEDTWRKSIRRRYGVLALFTDVGFAGLVLALVVVPFWIARRRRDRGRFRALVAADELADRRERESAIATLLGEVEQMGGRDDQIKGP
ncbi:MAG: hypothetical protein FJ202_03575 [Gemmatimonadetes bacterium]|nr:hypothetical protein [Gemmatimonadota bacterium]